MYLIYYNGALCSVAVSDNSNSSAAYDDCIRMLLALGSRDQSTSDVMCSSFMTSVMAEFVSGALRTSVSLLNMDNLTFSHFCAIQRS